MRRDRTDFVAVHAPLADVREGLVDNLVASFARVINIAEQIQSAYRRTREDENGIDEFVVFESGGALTFVKQLTVRESAAVEYFAMEIDSLVFKSLVDVVHLRSPAFYEAKIVRCSGAT